MMGEFPSLRDCERAELDSRGIDAEAAYTALHAGILDGTRTLVEPRPHAAAQRAADRRRQAARRSWPAWFMNGWTAPAQLPLAAVLGE